MLVALKSALPGETTWLAISYAGSNQQVDALAATELATLAGSVQKNSQVSSIPTWQVSAWHKISVCGIIYNLPRNSQHQLKPIKLTGTSSLATDNF